MRYYLNFIYSSGELREYLHGFPTKAAAMSFGYSEINATSKYAPVERVVRFLIVEKAV